MAYEICFGFALALYYALHSFLAAAKVKDWLQQHGLSVRWYRLLYNLTAIGTLLPVVYGFVQLPNIICGLLFGSIRAWEACYWLVGW